jgi:hypothetical protein
VWREIDLRWKWRGEESVKGSRRRKSSAMMLTKMKKIGERQLTTIFTTSTNII